MKKLIYSAAAMALAFFAASCQQENLEPVASTNTVIYTVQVADAVATKAIGDDVTAVNELVYEVYRTAAEETTTFTDADNLLYHRTAEIKNGVATIELEFVNDQNFTVLFWAHTEGNNVYDVDDLTAVTITSPDAANNVNAQAFVGRDFVRDCVSDANGKVTLHRPVSQLNIATTPKSLVNFNDAISLQGSSVKVTGLATTYNIATLSATGEAATEYEYTETAVPTDSLIVNGTKYTYVAMNYVGFAPEVGTNVTVSYVINTTEGNIDNEITNVPVKPNYRTNIIGNLITSKADYTITLDKQWYDADGGNMEVIEEGLIKNLNGDYEISEAKGLAYAMNNLFVGGGNFYLTAAEYDLTGFNVTAPTIPNGVTLNIYGETPVVTRAAVTFGGVTITGLPALINEVESGATVSVSGVAMPDSGAVLIEDNKGVVTVSDVNVGEDQSTGLDKLIGNNEGTVVNADTIENLETLEKALQSGVKTITLAADITAKKVVFIDRTVTINGNDKTFTTQDTRAFRLIASDIEVTINNLNIVSTAVRVGTSDVRGVSIDGTSEKTGDLLENITLTLNSCSHHFTDPSANDWAYAVNVVGGKGYKVTVDGGVYEGANVINIRGKSQTVIVKNTTLNCTYPANEMYAGACIYVVQNQGSSVYAEGNTFNGSNAIAFNLGTGTALEEKNNTDNTKEYLYKAGSNLYYTLADAIDAIESTGEVKVLHDAETSPVTIPAGKTITLDLNDKTVSNITTGTTNPQDAILVKGTLNVKNGTITTKHEGENLGWSAQSTVFNITAGGVVNLNAVTAKNLGGTDMGFVAHLNNWGEATLNVENSNLEANYVAVRVFNSGNDKNNVTIKNSTIKGGSYAFWVHNYTIADFGSAEKAITQYGLLKFNLTDGNTYVGKNDTPIRLGMSNAIYLAADQIGNLPTYASVDSEDTLIAALKAATVNSIIYFANDITVSNKWDNRYTGAKTSKPIEINGNGKTLKFTGEVVDMNYMSVFRFEDVATVKNLTIDLSEATNSGQLRAISSKSTLLVDNCKFIGKSDINSRGVIFGEGAGQNLDFSVSITNSEFTNWKRGITDNENAQDIKNVEIVANSFESAHVYVSAYENISFNDNILGNSCVNMRSYTSPKTVRITAKGNTLDSNLSQYNIIGTPSGKCNTANIDAQEGFTVYAE